MTSKESQCETDGWDGQVDIVCSFRSLAIRDLGTPITRYEHEVERSWCWPCFAVWTERLKALSRQGWGLGD